jgi:hypothetical protein
MNGLSRGGTRPCLKLGLATSRFPGEHFYPNLFDQTVAEAYKTTVVLSV